FSLAPFLRINNGNSTLTTSDRSKQLRSSSSAPAANTDSPSFVSFDQAGSTTASGELDTLDAAIPRNSRYSRGRRHWSPSAFATPSIEDAFNTVSPTATE